MLVKTIFDVIVKKETFAQYIVERLKASKSLATLFLKGKIGLIKKVGIKL